MNNTLTGLGLALVLALVAALVGPWFVNWSAYRDDIAAQAGALIGAPVRLAGAVDARLLPTPYLRLRGLTSGEGAARLTIDEAELELGVAPLLRGEIKAERVKLLRPRLGVDVAADGTVRTAFGGASGAKAASDRVSFERIEIVDGALVVTTPGAVRHVGRIAGQASVGSFSGPFRFDGRFSTGGEAIDAQLSTGRADDKGAMRLKLALGIEGAPPSVEADGALTLGIQPKFDGKVRASERSARRPSAAAAPEPWSVAAELKADARTARFENIDLGLGPEDRGLRLAGRAEVALTANPRVDLALQSRQVDLDRFLGENRPKRPAEILVEAARRFGLAGGAPLDGKISLDLRGLVLAGDVARDVAVEAEADAGAWRIRKLSAKLPGDGALKASGAVAPQATGAAFVGDVDFATGDLAGLRGWLVGGVERSAPVRRLALKGEVAAGPRSVAIEDAELTIGAARSTGRLAWRAAEEPRGRARLEAALASEELDLDALGLDRVLSQALAERPIDVVLALDAKRLTVAGVDMKDVSLDGSVDAGGVAIQRLEIRDASGASANGSGKIAPGANGPEGRLAFHVVAARLEPLLALARAAGAPELAVAAIDSRASAIAPLDVNLAFESDKDGRRVLAAGKGLGGAIDLKVSGDALTREAPLEIDLKVTSGDGRRLAALAGLELSPVVAAAGGELSLRLAGAPADGLKGEGRVKALGLELEGRGALTLAAGGDWSAAGDVGLRSSDIGVFAAAIGRLTPGVSPPLPVELTAKADASDERLRFDAIAGDVAGRAVRGSLSVPVDRTKPFEGEVVLDEAPFGALFAAAASPDALAGGGDARSVWPSAPFGPAPARGLAGRIAVKAARAPFGQAEPATDVSFDLDWRPNAVAVDRLSAAFAGGRLTGKASLARKDDDEATLAFSLQLDDAQAARLLGIRPSPAQGRIALKAEAQGAGASVSAIVGSLAGAGTAKISEGTIRRLDAAAIDRIEPRVEAGLALDAGAIAGALEKELAAADLRLDRAIVPFTISSGVVRASEIAAESGGMRIGGGFSLDLRRLDLDADLTLQPARPDAPQVGLTLHGPWRSPQRRLDATAFLGWLSVRAVERETSRIEAMEADIKERARIARQRMEEAKRVEDEKRRIEDEKRKAEADKRRREAEARAATETLRPTFPRGLPLDITPPGAAVESRPVTPPAGVFGNPSGVGGPNILAPPPQTPPTFGAPGR